MAARTTTQKADVAQTIAQKAYERFLSRGGEHGHDVEDWLLAESEVSAPKRAAAKTSMAKAKTPAKTAKK